MKDIRSELPHRDAFGDYAHVPSSLVAKGGNGEPPLVTIAIPTYRRPALLIEAVESALAQLTDIPFELLIVDNDPASTGADTLLSVLPRLQERDFRYYANSQNIGMFGNWNRCIELARGEWITLLNDDDLLDPAYLQRAIKLMRAEPRIEALACRKTYFRRGEEAPERPRSGGLRRLREAAMRRARFDRHGLKLVTPKILFFGNELGNGAGFLFKKQDALSLGGFQPEEAPSADLFFAVRIALSRRFYLTHEQLAAVALGDNESMRPETLRAFVDREHQLRILFGGKYVPSWWLRFEPWIVAQQLDYFRTYSKVELDREEIAAAFGIAVRKHNPALIKLFRLLARAY